ncbi:MAG TPA: MATE family efflux transporter [Actinomycetota bacterium]|nr:MATE family efflux transporter [Actinomycetota bacterium]
MFRASEYDRDILRLAIPALGSLAAEPLYVLVDTAVVGHLGRAQLGGLAVAGTLLTTSFLLFNFLAYGTTATVARAVGAGDRRAATSHAVQALWVSAALGVVLLALGIGLASPAVSLMGARGAVRGYALTYLRISALGAPAVLAALAGMGFVRGLQDTRTGFVVAGTANVFNLVLELVLIYGFGWGIAGSAWATVIAQYGAAAVFVGIIVRAARADHVALELERTGLRHLFDIGWPLVMRTATLLAALSGATAVAARFGTIPLAAHQIAFQVWSFLALTMDAIAIAAQAMIAHMLGAGRVDDARAASRRMLWWGVVVGLGLAVFLGVARFGLAPLFTSDASVVHVAEELLLIVALMQPLNAAVFVLDGVLIGASDVGYLAAAMAGAALFVFLPAAAVILRARAGVLWLWAAIVLLMLARCAGVGARYAGNRWTDRVASPKGP